MLELSLSGVAEILARVDGLPDQLREALGRKVEALAEALYHQVVDVNLDGGVVNSRSGALRQSIEVETAATEGGVGAKIFANGDTPYAAILENGGKTAAHDILPDKARALAFVIGGKQAFARCVHHPGSSFAARRYLAGALEDSGDAIAEGLRETVLTAATRLGAGS